MHRVPMLVNGLNEVNGPPKWGIDSDFVRARVRAPEQLKQARVLQTDPQTFHMRGSPIPTDEAGGGFLRLRSKIDTQSNHWHKATDPGGPPTNTRRDCPSVMWGSRADSRKTCKKCHCVGWCDTSSTTASNSPFSLISWPRAARDGGHRNRRGQAVRPPGRQPHGRRGAVGGPSLFGDGGAPCRAQHFALPVPLGDWRSSILGDSAARTIPEKPPEPAETASEPRNRLSHVQSGPSACSRGRQRSLTASDQPPPPLEKVRGAVGGADEGAVEPPKTTLRDGRSSG